MTAPRIMDYLCPTHVEVCRVRWPVPGNWSVLCDRCEACAAKREGLNSIKALPYLTPAQHLLVQAIHEAGHATAALSCGIDLTSVEIDEYGEGVYTTFADPAAADDAFALDRTTVLWAGQEAVDRWLAEKDVSTIANRVDARFLAWHDAKEFDEMVAQKGLEVQHDWGASEARLILAARWRYVSVLAAALAVHRRLSGHEISAIVG